jgi:hypothetical protein
MVFTGSQEGRSPMGMWVGRGRKARAAYGFDDIALVPGALTVNPNEVDMSSAAAGSTCPSSPPRWTAW